MARFELQMRLTKSEQHQLHPASPLWLIVALIRLQLRESGQLRLKGVK